MGESCVTIAQTGNDKARIAFSSLVHALHELDSYAVARIVLKDGKGPRILLLAPSIEPDLEAFYDVPLPFQEDVRNHRFPPLDRVLNTSGVPIPNHRNMPTEEQEEAMSNYIDKMDLSNFGTDDDGWVPRHLFLRIYDS
jgi:ATP-dependent DNA helicase 2 subunit 2